jgi:hypothetical protein
MSSYNEDELEETTTRIGEFRQHHRDEGIALIEANFEAAQFVVRTMASWR